MTFECVECFSEVQKVDEQGRCESCGESGLDGGASDVDDGTGALVGRERGCQRGSSGGADDGVESGDGGMADIRVARGLTQQQLADELGVSVRTISRWETGKATPSKMALKILRSEGL